MKVSFNGLYKIAGSPATAKGNGYTMPDMSNFKLARFLETTKRFRDKNGYSHYDKETGDYYISVEDYKEPDFEEEIKLEHINCRKVGIKVVHNDCSSIDENQMLKRFITNNF